MDRDEFKNALTEAGNKYDGHVTHGSIEEQMKIIDKDKLSEADAKICELTHQLTFAKSLLLMAKIVTSAQKISDNAEYVEEPGVKAFSLIQGKNLENVYVVDKEDLDELSDLLRELSNLKA